MAFFLVVAVLITSLIPSNMVFAQDSIESVESQEASNEYQILFEEFINGNIMDINSNDMMSAYEEGQTVTLQIIPNDGYTLDSMELLNEEDGSLLETTEAIDNKVSFTMPKANVIVSAQFMSLEDISTENVSAEIQDSNNVESTEGETEEISSIENEDVSETNTSILANNFEDIYARVMAQTNEVIDSRTYASRPAEVRQVAMTAGAGVSYEGYSTKYYSLADGTRAFCLEPNAKSPKTGTYTATEVQNDTLLAAIMFYGVGGPGYMNNGEDTGLYWMINESVRTDKTAYVYTHILAAYAYSGCSSTDAFKGVDAETIEGLKRITEVLRTQIGKIPSSYHAFIFGTGVGNQNIGFGSYGQPNTGQLNLIKTSTNPALTNGNSCYSFEGAQFGVYTDSNCSNQVATLITDVSGNSNTVELNEGNYYVKELVAPKGYALNSQPVSVVVTAGETATATFADIPQSDPVGILLGKVDKETNQNKPQGSAFLAGAEFTVKFYEGYYDTDPAVQGQTAIRKWVLHTDNDGMSYLNDNYKVSGDDFWYRTNGMATLPLGTITIQETKAPAGYLINSEVYVRKITSVPNTETVNTYNQPIIPEQSIRGGVRIAKRDSETKKNVPQGSATLGNAEFSIVTLNDNPVVVDGQQYTKGQVVKTIVTDPNTNIASTGANTLPFGNYKIYESKSPNGYMKEGTLERYFSIIENGAMVDLTSESTSILNNVIRGGVKICKRDYETKEAVPQGGATLGDARFNIITLNSNTVVVEGKEYSKGQVVKTIATDSTTNIASTAADTLPYGHYKIVEIAPPNGYLKDGAVEREFDIKENGKIVDLTSKDKSIYNKVIRGDIELSKFGRLSDTSEATEMNPLPGIIFSVTSNTTGQKWYLVTNKNGYADSASQDVYSKIIKNSNGTISVDKNSVVPKNDRGCFPYDTYTIKELNTPKGYMPINDITFHLTSEGYKYQWILEDKNVMSAVRIVKTDAETGKTIPLAGVTFKIYDKDMKQLKLCVSHYPHEQYADEFTTDDTGTFVLPEKLQVGTYYLEEISTPDGYLFGGIMKFEIEEGRDWAQPIEIFYPNENVKGKIKLAKTDSLYGNAVKGAVYGIYAREDVVTNDGTLRYAKDEQVDRIATDEHGEAISQELYLGKYYLKELETPDNYKLDDTEYDVELKYKDGKTPVVYTSLKVEDEPNTIYILKRDSETQEPLLGATLQLINQNGEVVDEWTTEKEPHEITKLPKGSYILHEKDVPKGYNIADDIEIEIKGGIETEVVTMDDVPIQTTFEKFDALDEENSLTGATYQLINSDGAVVDQWITEGKPHEIYAPEAGEYTVHEVEAPEGYDIQEDYQITVVESKDVQTFKMKDNPLRTQIDKKSSDTGESLVGATLQLIDQDGQIVDEWVTDGKPHEVYAIQQGTYTLHEKEAPDGYATAPDMTIEIKQTNEVQSFTMEDNPIIINVSKIEGDGKTNLAGATLQLINKDGQIVDEWITDGTPHETRKVPVGTYTLHEKEAPYGYALAKDMEIEVKNSNEIQYFTMTDKKIGSIVASMKKGANTPDGSILTKMGGLLFSPKTGDSSNILFMVILLAMSFCIILFQIYRNRKYKRLVVNDSKRKERTIKRKSFLFLLMIPVLALNSNSTVFAKNKDTDITKEYEYVTSDKEEKSGKFDKEIKEGKHTYSLENVKYQIEKSVPLMEIEEVTKTVESGLIDKSDTYTPEDTITEDGVTYTLEDCSVIDGSEYTKTYTAHYNYLETDTTIPENKIIGVTDENGNSVQINGKLSGTEGSDDGEWIDTSMNITFDHYDTGIFNWQGQTIYLNSEHPLQGYDSELLQSVGADTNTNRVVSTEWSGEPYEVDGIVYRNATANVQYFVPYVSATYTGTIDYVKYQSTYKGTQQVESTENFTYLMKAKATYSMENTFSVAQIVIFTTIGIAILAILVVLILSVISKRKKKEENTEKDYESPRRRKF